MSHYHAVVWIDHQRSTVWQFSPTEQQGTVVHAHGRHKVHSRKSTHVGHQPDAKFFDEVARALEGAHEILIIGPAQTKHEFAQYLQKAHAALARGIVAVQNADHPTDPQVLDHARRHFAAIDRMLSADGRPAP